MENYEIRIFSKGRLALICNFAQPSDFAAIRKAQLMTGAGGEYEVWHDLKCLYVGYKEAPSGGSASAA